MLTGKNALVTGASRGIGRQIALTLAAAHAFVIVNYNGSKEKADAVVAEIKAAGGDAVSYQCNVSDFDECQNMITALIKEYKHIDILVNNAGITRDGLIMKMSEADYDAVLDTNLKRCVQHNPSHVTLFPEAEIRKNYQYFISFRHTRKCRTGQLQRQQGRSYRTHKGCSQRACQPGNHSKCSGTGLCRDRDDRCACRCGKGESFITDSAWQTGKHKGYRKRSIIFSHQMQQATSQARCCLLTEEWQYE